MTNNNLEHIVGGFLPVLIKATVDMEISDEQQARSDYIEPLLLQSVLPKPKPRAVKRTEVFVITDYVEDEDNQVSLFRLFKNSHNVVLEQSEIKPKRHKH